MLGGFYDEKAHVGLYAGHLFWTFFSSTFGGSAYKRVGLYSSILTLGDLSVLTHIIVNITVIDLYSPIDNHQ